MKYSIKNQLMLVFIGIMTGTILLCWFLNNGFLGKYYLQNKQQVLRKAYGNINEAASNGSIQNENFKTQLQRLCGIYNISVIVIDADSKLVQSAGNDSEVMMSYLLDRVFLENNLNNYELIEQNENYIMEIAYSQRNGMTYIEMWGTLDNGNLFMTRSVVESIHESVQISNRFLAYVGMLAALVSGMIIWIITQKITNPILSLTEISKRMANLDFEVHYNGKEKNEIGILGQHMNEVSDKLETTISELKTANNELQKDIEKKEQIDEMRKDFLSNVSHELKTPIALIMGYAEGLKEINQDPESREFYCDVIMDEANKMNIMVKKLLTLNQLEFGNDVVSMERFDIRELIQNYLESADILIKQNEAKILFEETEPCFVWGDEFKVEEVFVNYFSNALNHVAGKKQIRIQFQRVSDKVRISIFNTGEQIPEEAIPHLFEKFYKVDKARTREYGGSGVGLSIVKAIMESMHQAYGVHNCEDGVEFWFELATK